MINTLPKKSKEYMEILVDSMGKASSKAQKLHTVITTFKRLQMNLDNQKMYTYCKKEKCMGFLKVGVKKLFVSTEYGDMKEITPLCVLDFYVHEDVQRTGIGKKLFDLMLDDCKIIPEKIAYDRPSEKLLKFLSKHFGLKRYLPQNNNFVVFSQYFSSTSSKKPVVEKSKAKTNDLFEVDEDAKGSDIYKSKPSYKVTYKKDTIAPPTKDNVISRDYISSLITTDGYKSDLKKMPVNEESKDGLNMSYNYKEPANDYEKYGDEGDSFDEKYALRDATNAKVLKAARNPILDAYQEDPKPSKSKDPEEKMSLTEIQRQIAEKEAELQEVMERISISSKGGPRRVQPAEEPKAPSKPNILTHGSSEYTAPPRYNPTSSKTETSSVVTQNDGPSHGHPSFSGYNQNKQSYTASGMRKMQFHSSAPWATSD